MKKIVPLTLIICTLFLSCSSSKRMSKAVPDKPLQDTYWTLKSIYEEDIDKKNSSVPSITFAPDGRYSGSFGCNRFFGNYMLSRKKIFLEYSGSTKKFCMNMDTENKFNQAIRIARFQFVIKGDTLLLEENGKTVLRFVADTIPVLPKPAPVEEQQPDGEKSETGTE